MSDGTNPISGATVTIGTDSETTDDDGEAVFESVYEGSQTVTVTKTGYADKTTTINVDESHTTFTIELEVVDTITITVDDGTDPIEGASVVIGEVTKTTDASGECTFTDMTYDDYSAVVSATGYTGVTESISFRSNHKSFTISLTAEQP